MTWNSNTDGINQTQAMNLGAASNAAVVTPNDSTDLTYPGFVRVGTSGDLKVDTRGGQTLILSNMQDGEFTGVIVTRVHSTSTTATNISVYY